MCTANIHHDDDVEDEKKTKIKMYQMNRDEGHTTHNKEYAETKVSHFVCVCVC